MKNINKHVSQDVINFVAERYLELKNIKTDTKHAFLRCVVHVVDDHSVRSAPRNYSKYQVSKDYTLQI